MAQEDKELLLKDLCARLPYGLKAKTKSTSYYDGIDILIDTIIARNEKVYYTVLDNNLSPIFNTSIESIKPYLRPMLSMTEKEKEDLERVSINNFNTYSSDNGKISFEMDLYCRGLDVDWLNAHHFDYRGLIEKGLAIEAPEGMYKTE